VQLNPLGGVWSAAYGVNTKGYIVGSAHTTTTGDGDPRAALWFNNISTVWKLDDHISGGLPAGWTKLVSAEAINDSGQIAGWGVKNGIQKAFLLTPIP
jgi:hypothetical protein